MTPTLIGIATLLLGFWLTLRRGPMALLCAVLALGLLEGSAGVILTSIGGSSIPPGRIMLGFLILSCFLQVKDDAGQLQRAIGDNIWLVIFCLYGFVSAFLLPRIFAGQIDVVPLRPAGLRHLLDVFPLHFSPQNITTAVYLIGTGLAALCSYLAVARAKDLRPIVTVAVAITVTHAVLGIMGVALKGTPWDLIVDFFRNGSYAQLNQRTESFIRINGLLPEPSSFAQFGFAWFVICFELWLRHIRPAATGFAAALMAVVLVLSTSSTAYVGLAGYAFVFACRAACVPAYLRADKLLAIGAAALLGFAIVGLMLIASSEIAQAFETMLRQMTVEKADSLSGQQRAFWAKQGLDAFAASYGLGIGAGSFRSSSIATAILGGMGVVGFISFTAYLLKLGWPRRAEHPEDEAIDIADAAGWAAMVTLIPAMVMQASPDPGMDFACLAGIAIGLRSRFVTVRRSIDRRLGSATDSAAPRQAGWRHVSR